MRTTAAAGIGIAAIALAFSLSACSSNGGTPTDTAGQMSSSSSEQPMTGTSLTGAFMGLNGKNVAGEVTITGDTVTLSGFSSDEGPDLHLYLTDGTDEAAVTAGTELGTVAFDQAAQTFTLHGVDASRFTDVVVHCDKAKAVFGAAGLS